MPVIVIRSGLGHDRSWETPRTCREEHWQEDASDRGKLRSASVVYATWRTVKLLECTSSMPALRPSSSPSKVTKHKTLNLLLTHLVVGAKGVRGEARG
ncbi:hypothetical protein E2C01_088432 [Portunus trituberculatus]|uniref:Uncharacterized protein n=1 Tax=Portunus trituberculatus TaxID=210409 RepID=A0A5B7JEG7_PORTR|nr:hypothetical protein [Portunus trituberculatus]